MCPNHQGSPRAQPQAGYNVIFLTRISARQPFVRQLPSLQSAAGLAELLETDSSQSAKLSEHVQQKIGPDWPLIEQVLRSQRLLTIHFSTVFEYLAYLEAIATDMEVHARSIHGLILKYVDLFLAKPCPG